MLREQRTGSNPVSGHQTEENDFDAIYQGLFLRVDLGVKYGINS